MRSKRAPTTGTSSVIASVSRCCRRWVRSPATVADRIATISAAGLDLVPQGVERLERAACRSIAACDGQRLDLLEASRGTCCAAARSADSGSTPRWRATLTTANSRSPSSSRDRGRRRRRRRPRPARRPPRRSWAAHPSTSGQSKPTLAALRCTCVGVARATAATPGTPSNTDVRPFSSRLIASQLASTVGGVRRPTTSSEHVRVAADELVVDPRGDVGDREAALLLGDRRVELDLVQQVAELLDQVRRRSTGRRGRAPGSRRRPRTSPRSGTAPGWCGSARGPTGTARGACGRAGGSGRIRRPTAHAEVRDVERREVIGLDRAVQLGPRGLDDLLVGRAEALQEDDRSCRLRRRRDRRSRA